MGWNDGMLVPSAIKMPKCQAPIPQFIVKPRFDEFLVVHCNLAFKKQSSQALCKPFLDEILIHNVEHLTINSFFL